MWKVYLIVHVIPIEKCLSLVLPRNVIMLFQQHHFIQSIIYQEVSYERLKAREYLQLLAVNVVAVGQERGLLTRDSKYSAWSSRRGDDYRRWLKPEVRLFIYVYVWIYDNCAHCNANTPTLF